jgi:hypothetical protein
VKTRHALAWLLTISFLACERGRDARLEALITEHPVLVLVSAVGVVERADSVCTEVIENGWEATSPDNLADVTTPDRLAPGHDWLRRKIAAVSRDAREEALARIEGRIEIYQDLMALESTVESLATAVAMTPALVDLLPPDIGARASSDPMDIGETLASGEYAELEHRLARRLGDMQPHERASVGRGLKETVSWAEAQRGAGDRKP